MRMLMLVAMRVVATAAVACSSPNKGDTNTEMCEAWCSQTDKAFDCGFCWCKACAFCGGSGASSAPMPNAAIQVPRDRCALGASVHTKVAWATGFRMHVEVQSWTPGAVFTLEWQGEAPTVQQAFSADVVQGSGSTAIFRLRRSFDEEHGFGFTARGAYVAPFAAKWFQADVHLPGPWEAGSTVVIDWSGTDPSGRAPVEGDANGGGGIHLEKVFFATLLGDGDSGGLSYSFSLGKPPHAPADPKEKEPAVRFRAKGVSPTGAPTIYCTDGAVPNGAKGHGETKHDGGHEGKHGDGDADVGSVFKRVSGPKGSGAGEDTKGSGGRTGSSVEADGTRAAGAARSSKAAGWVLGGVLVVATLMAFVFSRWGRAGGGSHTALSSTPDGKRRASHKKVVVVAENGSEHSASLSLDGLARVEEVREALTELMCEILDDDTLVSEDVTVELRDEFGRKRQMADGMPMSAVLRAASLRAKLRAPSKLNNDPFD